MSKKIFLCTFAILLCGAAFGQVILERYIEEGFEKNQGIQQQKLAFEKSVYALKEAKSLFLPNVTFMADYFLADGGRTVNFPAGDLLNPVYSSLNQLTNSNNFPQLENQSILLNPNDFYDAKFRTALPLLNLEIEYNKRIKREQAAMQQVEVDLYKRELAKEIKIAYFKYLQADQAIKIYDAALGLVRESKRINTSLFENDRVNRTVLFRADNEITKFEAIRENAVQNANSAKAYFNFLLNKNLTDRIDIDTSYQKAATFSGDSASVPQREELRKLQIGAAINQQVEGLSKSYIVPKLSTFLDIGSQGFDGQFDNSTRYYFLGVSLQWNLFGSGKNTYKIKQAQLDNQMIQSQTDYVADQLQLQFTTSIHQFNSSLFSYQAAVSTFATAQKFYADLLRQYKAGQILFIELLDAQNQLVQSQLQVNISLYDTYIKAAEIERANASFNIQNN